MQKIFRVHVETAGLSCAHWLLNVQQLWSLSQEANQTQPIRLRQVRLLKHWFRKRTVNSTLNWARTLDFEMFCSTLLGQFFKLGLLLELLVWQWTRFLATRYARHVKGIYEEKGHTCNVMPKSKRSRGLANVVGFNGFYLPDPALHWVSDNAKSFVGIFRI